MALGLVVWLLLSGTTTAWQSGLPRPFSHYSSKKAAEDIIIPARLFAADSSKEANNNEYTSTGRRALLVSSMAALGWTLSATGGGSVFVPESALAAALTEEETRRIAIFEKAAAACVFIDTFAERRDAFTTNLMEIPLGSGSGFVWNKEGYIVTNYHVIRNADDAQVAILSDASKASRTTRVSSSSDSEDSSSITTTISSPDASKLVPYTSMKPSNISPGTKRSVFKAKVVGVDPGKDIAVLKVDAPPELLQPISIGTSSDLQIGQTVLAIGNPFSLSQTLTTGVVSGLGREVRSPTGRPISNVIQTDASINPGNSGGPLLDSSGKLIGMNTAIYSPSGASAGIGFAIPIDAIKYVVETLIRDGQIVRPIIGISYLESKQARSLGINSGVLVLNVPEGSAAEKAGLKGTRRTESGLIEIGDIIVKVDGMPIERESDLFLALEDRKPGDKVKLTINRLAAVADELTVKTLVLEVELQSSSSIEKKMRLGQLQQYYQQQ